MQLKPETGNLRVISTSLTMERWTWWTSATEHVGIRWFLSYDSTDKFNSQPLPNAWVSRLIFLYRLQLLPFVCLPATFSPTCPHLQYSAIFQGRLAFSANYHALYFYYLHHLQRCTCKITLTCCCCSSIPLRFGYYRRQNKQKCLASNTRSLKSRRYLPRVKFISRHQEYLGRQTTSL